MTNLRELSKIMNPKTVFTRKCIGEAILALMKEHGFHKLTITSVVKKAGIARMTFYLHYTSLSESLTDYLHIIVGEFEELIRRDWKDGNLRDYSHILSALNFFDQYREYFITLSKNGLYQIMLDGINRFMENYFTRGDNGSVFDMYCYSGGLLNAFLKWQEGGKKESAEEVAGTIYRLYQAQ